MVSRRGLVVVPPFFSKDGESMLFPGPGPFPLADLRRYTLYWDRLEFPKNNVFDFEGWGEVEYLEGAGVLQRSEVVIFAPRLPAGLKDFAYVYHNIRELR